MASFRTPAIAIFLTALAARLLHVWQMRDTLFFSVLMGDARGYDAWAQGIAAGEWIGRDVFYQAPLYPYFLGTIYAVFGRDLLIVRVIQTVLGAISCVALGYAGSRLISRHAGLIAGLMLALYAPAIFFDGLLQKSVLDVFFVCLSLATVARIAVGTEERSPVSLALWVLLGVIMGCLSLTRENALVMIAVILVWALTYGPQRLGESTAAFAKLAKASAFDIPFTASPWLVRVAFSARAARLDRYAGPQRLQNPRYGPHNGLNPRSWRHRRIAQAVLFAAGLATVLVPVAVRNYVVGGGLYLTTSQFGSNLYIGNNPLADGSYMSLRAGRGSPEFERVDATELAEHARGRRLTPAEVSRYWTDRAVTFIQSQPGAWLRLLARKVRLLSSGTEVIDTESQESHAEYSIVLQALGKIWHFGIVLPLAVIGVWTLWPQWRRVWPLYAMTAGYAASVILFFVVARYRYPLVPFAIFFAAGGVVGLRERIQGVRLSRLVAMSAVAVLMTIVSNWPLYTAEARRAITENNLGTALQEDGRAEEAIERYRRALTFDAHYTPAINNLGTALRAVGRVDEAVAAYDKALVQDGNRTTVHVNRGNALLAQGRLVEAISSFRQAYALDPRDPHVRASLANALYDLGTAALEHQSLGPATAALRETIQLKPDYAEAHNNLGIAFASQGEIAEAVKHWKEAIRLKPGFADAVKNLQMAEQARK